MERINKELHVYSGIKPRYDELMLNLTLLGPSVFCLQETFLKTDNFTFKGFNVYNHIHWDCARASGGSSILIKSSLPQRKIKLKAIANLQVKAVSVSDLVGNPEDCFFFTSRLNYS